PGSSQDTTVTFTNTTGAPVTGVELSIAVPARWTSVLRGSTRTSTTIVQPVPPGSSASATFTITSGLVAWNGDLVASARWTAAGLRRVETAIEKVRNVRPVKINEFQIASGAPANPTNSFIELHNAGTAAVDISNWTLTEHAILQASFSAVKIPTGTKLPA